MRKVRGCGVCFSVLKIITSDMPPCEKECQVICHKHEMFYVIHVLLYYPAKHIHCAVL